MQSSVPMMWPIAVLLFISVTPLNAAILINCQPRLVSPIFVGGVTATGFALQDFCCLVQFTDIQPTDNVVVIVASSGAIANFNLSSISFTNPPLYVNFSSNGVNYYAALSGTVAVFCNGPLSPFGAVSIGDAFFCRQLGYLIYCNGPLFPGFPYRVALLVYRNGELLYITPWSDEIVLRNPQAFQNINTKPNSHSASMIVVTSVLPVLTALLLCIFATALILRCCCAAFSTKQCRDDC
ncbi:uroplakin-3b-like [Mantella aurantiaca]